MADKIGFERIDRARLETSVAELSPNLAAESEPRRGARVRVRQRLCGA